MLRRSFLRGAMLMLAVAERDHATGNRLARAARAQDLETFWRRKGAAIWSASVPTDGDAFPRPLEVGDQVTWLLAGRLPHVAIVVSSGFSGARVVHNIGGGAQEIALAAFRTHRAKGHFAGLRYED